MGALQGLHDGAQVGGESSNTIEPCDHLHRDPAPIVHAGTQEHVLAQVLHAEVVLDLLGHGCQEAVWGAGQEGWGQAVGCLLVQQALVVQLLGAEGCGRQGGAEVARPPAPPARVIAVPGPSGIQASVKAAAGGQGRVPVWPDCPPWCAVPSLGEWPLILSAAGPRWAASAPLGLLLGLCSSCSSYWGLVGWPPAS